MAASQPTKLEVKRREVSGSRAVRRLRRSGMVPGVLYGGDGDPIPFEVGERVLRHALAGQGAVLDLWIDDDPPTAAVLKDAQRHPVRGQTLHVDLVRVRLDIAIHAVVPLELIGGDDAPGVKDGGVLEQITHVLNVQALPTAVPESIVHDVSGMDIGDTITLASLVPPDGVELLDDPEHTIATLSPPRVQTDDEPEIEGETEIVGGAKPAAGDDA
ncbi:MAG: large subunit ribosomal protein [Solirubrobacteraceae bacterium]|nr:large subunit ribosomal protein [Solirubrobacteraceae bacterium]